VSQPSGSDASALPPLKVDRKLGEFWIGNPFGFPEAKYNLSSYERKRVFLNVADELGRNFLDISYLTGADNDSDGRCVVAGDFSNNGRMDLVVRQVGGGPLLFYENNFPQRHYLKVSLRGNPQARSRFKSNRLGIGARLVATVKGQPLVRELYPHNSFTSQMPNIVHFGLGDADRVDRLTIRWPSGKVQVLKNLAADRHIVVDEGKEGSAAVETVIPGKRMRP
jgi:hypothetical protein